MIVVLLLGVAMVLIGVKLVARLSAPSDVERIYRTGLSAMDRGELAAVQAAAEALADLPDAQPQRHLLEGIVHLRSGRLPAAIASFRPALEHPDTASLANMLAGETLYRNGQYRDAIEALKAATQQDSSLTDAHRRLAAVLYDIGASEAAVNELRIVSEQDPTDPRPHRMLGLIYKDMESFEQASVEYREALRRDPLMPLREDVLLELATCLLKTLRFDELDEVVAESPRSADFLAILAEARLKQEDTAEAARLIEEALRLQPDHYEAQLLKGSVELAQGAADQAAATLEKVVAQQPMDFRAHHKLSQAYSRLGQVDRARTEFEEGTRIQRLRATFANLHGHASVDTDNADLRYQLGVVARQLGREDLAVSWFTTAVALDPAHAGAREALQAISAATRDTNRTDQPPAKKDEHTAGPPAAGS
jgi:tetratricopeptide (TPR) repeat protein